MTVVFVVFFQAEDGIRDLVGSEMCIRDRRMHARHAFRQLLVGQLLFQRVFRQQAEAGMLAKPVSYTHLTLPTSDLV